MPQTAQTLAQLIRAAPNRRLELWLIHIEDRYETAFGDGFFTYAQRAFFDKQVAEKWAAWINVHSRKETPRSITLGYNATVQSQIVEEGNITPANLLELLNTGSFDWKRTIDYCMEESGEPVPTWKDIVPVTWSGDSGRWP